jgi:prevent-host-death family protein
VISIRYKFPFAIINANATLFINEFIKTGASYYMSIKSKDIVPINQVRARFTELAEEVRQGSEKIVTRNGESYVALVDARRLDYYHQLEKENIHLVLLQEVKQGLSDIEAGKYSKAAEVQARYQTRVTKKSRPKPGK